MQKQLPVTINFYSSRASEEPVEKPEAEKEDIGEIEVDDCGFYLLSPEQQRLLSTSVSDLDEDELFKYIPFCARLADGVSDYKELVQRQRSWFNKMAGTQMDLKPPETRLRPTTF